MTDPNRRAPYTSVFEMMGEVLNVITRLGVPWLKLSYTEARVKFRLKSWWADAGFNETKSPELYAAAREYAVHVISEPQLRKLSERYRQMMPVDQHGVLDTSLQEFDEEIAALRTLLIGQGIDADALVEELKHP